MKALVRLTLFVLFVTLFFLLLAVSPAVAAVMRAGYLQIKDGFLPSLFPFLYFGAFLSELSVGMSVPKWTEKLMRRVFRLPGRAATVWLIGLVCGFPSGALAVERAVRSGEFTEREGMRMLLFVSAPSPAFCVSFFGGTVLHFPTLGLCVYLSCVASDLLLALLTRPRRTDETEDTRMLPSAPQTVSDALLSATARVLRAFAFLSALYLGVRLVWMIPEHLLEALHAPKTLTAFLYGLLDSAGGCAALKSFPPSAAALVGTFFLSFQGCAVTLQSTQALKAVGMKIPFWLTARAACAGISCIFLIILRNFL